MGSTCLYKRIASYTALCLAVLCFAPQPAMADAAAQAEARWHLPQGHWAYMCCDYLEESGVIEASTGFGKTHFDGAEPVLLADFAREVQNLARAAGKQPAQQEASANEGATNAKRSASRLIPPLREIACDLASEIYGLANARGLVNDDAAPQSSELLAQLAQLRELWRQLGDPGTPLHSAVPGNSCYRLWGFSALADSQEWAGLEVIGLIRCADNAPDGAQMNSDKAVPATLKPTDWQYISLLELLEYTHSTAVDQLYAAALPRDRAVALYAAALAALRQLPELDSHILLTAWDLGAEFASQPDAPEGVRNDAAISTNFGGLAARCHTPLDIDIPVSAYGDVPLDHWMYPALDYLTNTGWVEGYPADFFSCGRLLTSYEFAQATARLLDKVDDPAKPCRDRHVNLLAAELRAATYKQLSAMYKKLEGLLNRLY